MDGVNKLFLLIISIGFSIITHAQIQPLDNNILRLENHVSYLSSKKLMGRASGSEFSEMAFNYIKNQFEEIGLDTHTQILFNNPSYKNIIGIIRGNHPKLRNEWIVIGAHYDHIGFQTLEDKTYYYWSKTEKLQKVRIIDNNIKNKPHSLENDIYNIRDTIIFNGADDNASGLSLIIELARLIYSNKENLNRSIAIIGYDANELGRNGSIYFVNHGLAPYFTQKDIKLSINIDMIGHLNKDSVLYICGMESLGKPILAKKDFLNEYKVEYRTEDIENNMNFDNNSFSVENIPSLLITTGIKHYNRREWDNAKYIDYQGINLVKDYLYNNLSKIDNAKKISFNRKNKDYFLKGPDNNNYFGINIGFGSNEHYYKEGTMTSKTSKGLGVGLFYWQTLNDFFVIKPELAYEYKRANRVLGSMEYHSLSLPIGLYARYATINNSFEISIGSGGFYSYNIDAKNNLGDESQGFEINRNTLGLHYSIEFRVLRYIIGYQAKYGFYNIIDSPYGKSRPTHKFLKIGYIF